jgi:acyl carrier protein phosphodiesterase
MHYQNTVRRMLERRWLHTYENLGNTAYALQRIGERFTRETPLADALPGLKAHYGVMEDAFLLFFPQLQHFSDGLIAEIFKDPAAGNGC